MAQQGYGLSNAVGGFFDTYFKVKEMRMKEDQFNRNMAEEQRQFSLLQAVRESELLRQRQSTFITPKEGDIYTKYGLPAGQEIPIQLADNLLSLANPKTKETKVTTSMVRQGNKFVTYEHEEGASPSSGKIIGESPIRESNAGSDALTVYQQMMQDEKKQKRIEKNILTADALIKAVQENPAPLKDKSGKEITNSEGKTKLGYKIGDASLPENLWKTKATTTINSLLSDYGLVNVKNKLLSGAKVAAKKQGIDFDSAKPETKREYLKKLLDSNQEIPEEEKDVLYKFVEVYTR